MSDYKKQVKEQMERFVISNRTYCLLSFPTKEVLDEAKSDYPNLEFIHFKSYGWPIMCEIFKHIPT